MDLNHNVYTLYQEVKDGKFKSCICTRFTLHTRGKERFIETVSVRERTVQKAICNYALKPLLIPTLIRDNYATVKGRGMDDALRRMKVFLHKHYKEHGLKGGVLTIDLHSYFDNINHEKLINMLYEKLDDHDLVTFVIQFITMFERDNGISVGNESSQLFAVFFLNSIDHFIKEELHIKHYGRYMDDIYLVHEDTEYLNYCLKVITKKINELGIQINPKHTQIHPFAKHQDFSFLKKRVRLQNDGKIVVRLEPKAIQKRRRNMK